MTCSICDEYPAVPGNDDATCELCEALISREVSEYTKQGARRACDALMRALYAPKPLVN